ncbi:MAG: hypothetical protein ACKN81_04085, partial [Pirellulaceae bacterium]
PKVECSRKPHKLAKSYFISSLTDLILFAARCVALFSEKFSDSTDFAIPSHDEWLPVQPNFERISLFGRCRIALITTLVVPAENRKEIVP